VTKTHFHLRLSKLTPLKHSPLPILTMHLHSLPRQTEHSRQSIDVPEHPRISKSHKVSKGKQSSTTLAELQRSKATTQAPRIQIIPRGFKPQNQQLVMLNRMSKKQPPVLSNDGAQSSAKTAQEILDQAKARKQLKNRIPSSSSSKRPLSDKEEDEASTRNKRHKSNDNKTHKSLAPQRGAKPS
jgi:hypothetical protein